MFKNPRDEALALFQRGEFQKALPKFFALLDQNPDDPEFWYYVGSSYTAIGFSGMAVGCLEHAAALKPNFYEALYNLGIANRRLMRFEDAEAAWMMCLEATGPSRNNVEDAGLWAMIGALHVNTGDPEKGMPAYRKGLELDPDNALVKANLGLAQLELGQWDEAWKNYDYSFKNGTRTGRQHAYDRPEWDGTKGGTLIVAGEQGIGDEIMFASILPDVQRDVDKLVIDCHPRLETLFKRHYDTVYGYRKVPTAEWAKDYPDARWIMMGSLGRYYRTTAESFPRTPYFKVPKWEPPRPTRGKMKIGVAWSGGSLKTHTEDRSLTLAQLAPLIEAGAECDWYSLQYTQEAARDVCALEEKTGIRISHYPDWVECYDYDRTAQFVAGMDLVISVCTTVVHMAGSLGVPCWVLTPKRVAWRYGLAGDMPWYQSVKCYRQETPGEWGPVLARVVDDLKAAVAVKP